MFGGTNNLYIHKEFKAAEGLGRSSAGTASDLYRQIVEYANKHKYKIVTVGKMEDAHMSKMAINVIFENEK
ncbi:MAG: hypothetical protein Q4A10_06940 [Aerococcaceae bacterium]|nr:hypothetical protein [Aerococcaceae bacterium]